MSKKVENLIEGLASKEDKIDCFISHILPSALNMGLSYYHDRLKMGLFVLIDKLFSDVGVKKVLKYLINGYIVFKCNLNF